MVSYFPEERVSICDARVSICDKIGKVPVFTQTTPLKYRALLHNDTKQGKN